MSVFGFKEPSSKELGCSPQTPTLIGCIFLRIEAENFFFTSDSLRSVKSCILAQLSLHFQRFLRFLLYPAKQGREENARSEEHTSELQSQSNLVCRLLLEKKTTPS